MKDYINYSYNIDILDLEELNDYYRFYLDDQVYYFVPFNRSKEELDDIILCSKELKNRGINCHDILLNRFNNIETTVGDRKYILIRVVGNEKDYYDITDIVEINNTINLNKKSSKLYKNNWGTMWSEKNDYFEYQIRELGKGKSGILNSFNYYIGLAENAICYVNKTIKNYTPTDLDRICLSHRRLFFPNIKLNYLNPLCFIFDLEVRDVASYIKNLFFYGEDAYEELELYLKLRKLSIYGYQMLYGRLLYPTYYFDIYEKIMNEDYNQDKLIDIVNKVDDYELFLKKVYFLIASYSPIEKVEWIINKKEL